MNRLSVRITSTILMSGIGGVSGSPTVAGMMMFFFITTMAYAILDLINLFFGDDWT